MSRNNDPRAWRNTANYSIIKAIVDVLEDRKSRGTYDTFVKVESHKETTSFKGKVNDLADYAAELGAKHDTPCGISECLKQLPTAYIVRHSDNSYVIREHNTFSYIYHLFDSYALSSTLSSKVNRDKHFSFFKDPLIWFKAARRLPSQPMEHRDIFGTKLLTHSLPTPRNISNKPDIKKYLPMIFPGSICPMCRNTTPINLPQSNGTANEFHCTCECPCINKNRHKISGDYLDKFNKLILPLKISIPSNLWHNFLFPKTESLFTHGKPPKSLLEWILEMTGHENDSTFSKDWPHLMHSIEKGLYYIFRDAYHEAWCLYQDELYKRKLGYNMFA